MVIIRQDCKQAIGERSMFFIMLVCCTCLLGERDRDGLVPLRGLMDLLLPPKGLVVLPGDLLRGVLADTIDVGGLYRLLVVFGLV